MTTGQSVEKAADAFRTISETAEDLDLPQHVLRFWETRFSQIRPMKRGGGRRYYRPDDIDLLRGIRYLLYGEGYTIKGVQRILKEQGVRFVMEVWRHPGEPIPTGNAAGSEAAEDEGADTPIDGDAPSEADEDGAEVPVGIAAPSAAVAPVLEAKAEDAGEGGEPLPAGILPEDSPPRGGFKFMDRFRASADSPAASNLSREDIRKLQATLFELLECKRLLDQTR